MPPASVSAAQVITAARGDGPTSHTVTPPAIATRLNIDDARPGAVYFSSALSAPIATTASEIAGKNGIMIWTSVAHSAAFSGEKPVATSRTTGPGNSIPAAATNPR